jgi:hypothetical protein
MIAVLSNDMKTRAQKENASKGSVGYNERRICFSINT